MSYSFNVRAATREAVLAEVQSAFDKMVEGQPIHSNDRDGALAAAKAFVELLPESPEGQEITVSMNGSLGWNDQSAITRASVSVSAWLVTVEKKLPETATEG